MFCRYTINNKNVNNITHGQITFDQNHPYQLMSIIYHKDVPDSVSHWCCSFTNNTGIFDDKLEKFVLLDDMLDHEI